MSEAIHSNEIQTSAPKEKRGVVTVEGAGLGYCVEGSGVPCMVILTSVYGPRMFSLRLKNKLQLIHTDTRMFAPAIQGFDINRITMDTFVEDIEAIRRELGIQRTAILGHSAFGLVALAYAHKYPERVSHLIMNGTPPHNVLETQAGEAPRQNAEVMGFWESLASPERKAIFKRKQDELPGKLAGAPPEKAFGIWYASQGPLYWYDAEFDCTPLWEGVETNPEVILHFFGSVLQKFDAERALAEISMPVFLSMGLHDYAIPYVLWDKYKNRPGLSYNLFERSGHSPMIEEPEEFDSRLMAFLKR
jgi:proline iminopeptidase